MFSTFSIFPFNEQPQIFHTTCFWLVWFMCPQKNEIKVACMQPLNLLNNFWNFNLERKKNRFCMFFTILIVWFEHFKDWWRQKHSHGNEIIANKNRRSKSNKFLYRLTLSDSFFAALKRSFRFYESQCT